MEYNLDRFYSSDADTGIAMLRSAYAEYSTNREANLFLRNAAVKPHDLPDVHGEAVALFWQTQEQYFYSLLHRNFPTYGKAYEDCMSAIKHAFLVALPRYNTEYEPGTYFTVRAHNAAYNEIRRQFEFVPEHKLYIKKLIMNQVACLEEAGLDVSVDSVRAALPDVSEDDVKRILPMVLGNGIISLDACGNDQAIAEKADPKPTPEDLVIQKDKSMAIHDVLVKTFSPRERDIIAVYYSPESGRQKVSVTAKRMKENFPQHENITEDEIRKLVNDVGNRILNTVIDRPDSDYVKAWIKNSPSYNAKRGERQVVSTEQEHEYFSSEWVKTADYVEEEPRRSIKEKEIKGKSRLEIAGQLSVKFGNSKAEMDGQLSFNFGHETDTKDLGPDPEDPSPDDYLQDRAI